MKISANHKSLSFSETQGGSVHYYFLTKFYCDIFSGVAAIRSSSPWSLLFWGLWNVVSRLVLQRKLLGMQGSSQNEAAPSLLAVPQWVGCTQSQGCALWSHHKAKDWGSTGGLESRATPCLFRQGVPVKEQKLEAGARKMGGGAKLTTRRRSIMALHFLSIHSTKVCENLPYSKHHAGSGGDSETDRDGYYSTELTGLWRRQTKWSELMNRII